MSACESFPNGLPPGLENFLRYVPKGLDDRKILDSSREYSQSDWEDEVPSNDPVILGLEVWSRLTLAYLNCALTREEDKLIAVSGLAKEIQNFIQARYLASLWNKFLVPQLPWQLRPDGGYRACRPSKYRAPSWSWASTEGPFHFITSGQLSGDLIQVIDAKVCPAGIDPTGTVISGYLKLKAYLHPVGIVREDDDFVIEGLT
jgi:hypothetical protein